MPMTTVMPAPGQTVADVADFIGDHDDLKTGYFYNDLKAMWNRRLVLDEVNITGKPVFNMGRAGRRWSREWQAIKTDFAETQAALERHGLSEDNADVDLTPEQQDDVVRLMRMIDAASERQDRLVGEVLVSVPDGWLIPDAPECHVDHVREDRYGEVIAALQEARADTSKN